MNIVDLQKNKNVRVIEVPRWGVYLRKRWEDHFANHLRYEEKKLIYLLNNRGACGYLWHLFSYGKKECLKEAQAIQAFHYEVKNICYVFYQHGDDAFILENASGVTFKDLLNEEDVYVVDRDFNWTFVKTHESMCGPYFSRNDQ